MTKKQKPEYEESSAIEWHRRVLVAGWCVLTGFVIAVLLVCLVFYLFVPPY